jgi:hypothetical protein
MPLAALLITLAAAPTPADILSTFDTNLDGWTITGDAAGLSFVATGGNPAGRARGADSVAGSTWFFLAPPKFLGNQSAAYGSTLSFDLTQEIIGAPAPYNDNDVLLSGAGLTLAFDTPANPTYFPAWASYAVPLTASAGWRVNSINGAPATESQLRSVLANLTALRIRGEYQSGADSGSLDNVRLPSTLPGDANRNGVIDRDDFALTDRGLAKGLTGWSNGDFNGDDAVTPADLAILNASFAAQSPAAIALNPEPATLTFVGTLATFALARPRRHRPPTCRPGTHPPALSNHQTQSP